MYTHDSHFAMAIVAVKEKWNITVYDDDKEGDDKTVTVGKVAKLH